MSFHEIRFPTTISFGSVGGPERLTDVVTLANGHEERNTPWAHSRRRYDAGLGMRSADDVALVLDFFEARRGRLHGFRWKDWADYKSCLPSRTPDYTDQLIARGDEIKTDFQLIKTYRSGIQDYVRVITKPVFGTVFVGLDSERQEPGVHYNLNYETGILSFVNPPDIGVEITAGFEFDVPVRFDTDRLEINMAGVEAGQVPDVPLIEVRL